MCSIFTTRKNLKLQLKKIYLFQCRATRVARYKFAAETESIFWPALSVGVLVAQKPISPEFAREYPNSRRGF